MWRLGLAEPLTFLLSIIAPEWIIAAGWQLLGSYGANEEHGSFGNEQRRSVYPFTSGPETVPSGTRFLGYFVPPSS